MKPKQPPEEPNENLPLPDPEAARLRMYKPTQLLSEDMRAVIDKEKEDSKSKVITWYNESIDPYHNGLMIPPHEISSLGPLLDKAFHRLPVDLSPLINRLNPHHFDEFLRGNLIERLLVTVLNEEDNRIASIPAKKQVMHILEGILKHSRQGKVRLRLAIQPTGRWIDEVYEPDTPELETAYQQLFREVKAFFLRCWRITDEEQLRIMQTSRPELSLEQTKQLVLREYTAIQLQAVARSFLARRRLHRNLAAAQEEQQGEIRKWSIVLIQKLVRGFLARRTVVRSLRIRKKLSKELLRIVERFFLANPAAPTEKDKDKDRPRKQRPYDVWGFLEEVNEELLHFKKELQESDLRESIYAEKFVEKVVRTRQREFSAVWDQFPLALDDFTRATKNENLIGSLLPPSSLEDSLGAYGPMASLAASSPAPLASPSPGKKTKAAAGPRDLHEISQTLNSHSLFTSASFQSPSNSQSLGSLPSPAPGTGMGQASVASSFSPAPHQSTAHSPTKSVAKGKGSAEKVAREISVAEVSQAMAKNGRDSLLLPAAGASSRQETARELTGPLIRKALQVTVQQEVTQQLNHLMRNNFHSRKLSNDIAAAYGPDSVYVKGEATQKLTALNRQRLEKFSGSSKGKGKGKKTKQPAQQAGGFLQPIDLEEMRRRQLELKQRRSGKKSLDGKAVELRGQIESAHGDWMDESLRSLGRQREEAEREKERTGLAGLLAAHTGDVTKMKHEAVHAGHNLLLDVPNGLEDSLERFIHAAALRCYVPDFFRGPRHEPLAEEGQGQSSDESLGEADDEQVIRQKRLKKRLKQQRRLADNPNADPARAYQLFLQMPLGLARVRYELECQRWSQGVINRLRIKGLVFLPDVAPLSKFVVCLKSVDTPRVLLEKCVDLFLELRALAQLPRGQRLELQTNLSVADQPSSPASSRKKKSRPGEAAASTSSQSPGAQEAETEAEARNERRVSFSGDQLEQGQHEDREEDAGPVLALGSQQQEAKKAVRPSDDFPEGFSAFELSLLERANRLLQEVLESTERAEWCSLTANIEELFIQAAFLVVPHRSQRFPHWLDLVGRNERRRKAVSDFELFKEAEAEGEASSLAGAGGGAGEDEALMGNFAYKLYMMELFTLRDEEEKVDFVKARFRAAVIFTSPFTLYLKSRGVTAVRQLLTVDLKDLALPRPLFAQLEILLNIVVSRRIVRASLLSVPRDRYDLAADSFYTPMFYDQKFQRTPLDMFGKPIGVGATAIKDKLRARDAQRQEKQRISANDFDPLVEADLGRPVGLWERNAEAVADEDEDDKPPRHPQHLPGSPASKRSAQSVSMTASLSSRAAAQPFSFAIAQLDGPALHEVRALLPPSSSLSVPTAEHPAAATPPTSQQQQPADRGRQQRKAVRAEPSLSASLPAASLRQAQEMVFPSHPLVDPKLTRTVFHQTYVCEHPQCGQLFSRLYTYKVHLRTHQNFPDYFRFKRDPQLALDPPEG